MNDRYRDEHAPQLPMNRPMTDAEKADWLRESGPADGWASTDIAIQQRRAEKAEKERDEWKARAERAEKHLRDTRSMLRAECCEIGDNNWPDQLHLADVVEKHLARPVRHRLEQAEQERDALRAELAGVSGGAWISVKERMPDDGALVLTCDEDDYSSAAVRYYHGGEAVPSPWQPAPYEGCEIQYPEEITHWMPLPTPPASAGDGRGESKDQEHA